METSKELSSMQELLEKKYTKDEIERLKAWISLEYSEESCEVAMIDLWECSGFEFEEEPFETPEMIKKQRVAAKRKCLLIRKLYQDLFGVDIKYEDEE